MGLVPAKCVGPNGQVVSGWGAKHDGLLFRYFQMFDGSHLATAQPYMQGGSGVTGMKALAVKVAKRSNKQMCFTPVGEPTTVMEDLK